MKAALLDRPHFLVLTDIDPPDILSPDQVLIQVKAVGVCGSEVHAFEGTHPYRVAPVVLGHEMAGVIVKHGTGVRGFEIGDRVVVDPQWSCGECRYCHQGDINLCLSKRVLGTVDWPGAFGEFIIAPEKAVFVLPKGLSFIQGAMLEPLTIAVHVARRAGIKSGDAVAILGTGSIGNYLSGVCHAYGAGTIVVADIRQHCMDAAIERLGANLDILLPDDQLVEKVKDATGGDGVDAVFIAADDPALVNQAIHMVRRGGTIVLVALLNEDPLSFKGNALIAKEIQLVGSIMSRHEDVKEAIRLAVEGEVDLDAIVTHILPIEEAQTGMLRVKDKTDAAIKAVLTFDGALLA
jgi:2-desacetyl-2-hydroxyethyl bacteriochlorophyllide A dehydrogenase